MKFEIINPHDKAFLEAPTYAIALAAIGILGEGTYGLRREDGTTFAPPILMGDWCDEVYEAAGISPPNVYGILLFMDDAKNNEAVAACLDTVRSRTSMTDLERRAKRVAQATRGKRTFESAEK